ncbi:MAG: hypothetical protein SGJ13_16290 [Actinomycetota bacterium]|nr:hypothetical protein [Actinomycetota bacterium]
MKRFKKCIGASLAVGLAASALAVISSTPADATVKVGAINCTANIPALGTSVALQQPSTSHLTGPYWVDTGSAFTVTNVGGTTGLPSAASGIAINDFRDVITKAQVVGQPTTTLSTTPTLVGGFAGDGFFYFDNDIGDATAPVKMDGLLTNPAAPTIVIAAITSPAPIPGAFTVTTTLDPGVGTLDIIDGPPGPGNGNGFGDGGAVFSPDVIISVTNAGTTDGPINYIGTSTALTAKILGVIDAITACAPSASPAFTAHVQTDGTPVPTAQSPVVACDPADGTGGTNKASKGLATAPLLDAAASTSEVMTFTGCRAPDAQSNAWNPAKLGPLTADAITLDRASISIKGKNFGNCTLVDKRTGAGQLPNKDSAGDYETYSVATIKWLNSLLKPVKGASTTSASLYSRIIINTNGYAPEVTSEHNGVVTKGFGAGGVIEIVSELDTANADVADVIDCNSTPPGAVPVGVYLQKIGLPLLTADDAVLEIQIP